MREDNPITYHFMRKLGAGSTSKWESTVVISWKDRKYLPTYLEEDGKSFHDQQKKDRELICPAGAMTLCKIVSDTTHLKQKDFEKVSPKWYNPWGEVYFIAKYKVKVNIEVADILFEVWFDDRKLSKDQRIDVRWKEGAEESRPVDSNNAKDIFWK